MSIEVFGISILIIIILIFVAIVIWENYKDNKPSTPTEEDKNQQIMAKRTQERPVDITNEDIKTNNLFQSAPKISVKEETMESNPTEIAQELKGNKKEDIVVSNKPELPVEVKDIEKEEITESKLDETLQEEAEIVKPKLIEKYTVQFIQDGFITDDSLRLGINPQKYFFLEFKDGDNTANFYSIDSEFTRGMVIYYWSSKFLPYFEEVNSKLNTCNKIVTEVPAIFKRIEGGWKFNKKGIIKLS